MPCACKAPIETYPENAEWGPIVWKILHRLSFVAGRQTDPNLQADERRFWISLLQQLQPVLPCDICRTHYAEWLAANNVQVLLTIPYASFGNWVQTYLWNLHNTINEGNDKPLVEFEALEAMYSSISISKSWKALEPIMRKAIQLNGVTILTWKKWLNHVRQLQGLYGVA